MPESTDPAADTAARYRSFGSTEAAGMSPVYESWALAIADDPEVLALIDGLPPARRQPNLVFAAARAAGGGAPEYARWRSWLIATWTEVARIALARSTQTNEPVRCAALLPVLAGLDGPLALLEVGASAGLCLLPDRYSYRYGAADGRELATVDPSGGTSAVVLECEVSGGAPLPERMPEVVWRAGIDLAPLDVRRHDDVNWLDALIWPEHDDRRARLRAAAALAAQDPPPIHRGDLNARLTEVAAEAPADATLVVFHTAVLMYLDHPGRQRFVDTVRTLPGHWISNEGRAVMSSIRRHPDAAARPSSELVLALDGVQLASTQPHGRSLHWLGSPDERS